LEFDDYTVVLLGALTVGRGDDGNETVDICLGLFLVGGVADRPERM
jgi:hypothetical protein